MKPKHFPEANAIFGETQPEYQPLPAYTEAIPEKPVITCWELTPEEITQLQESGVIWVTQLSFGKPLQPILVAIEKPTFIPTEP